MTIPSKFAWIVPVVVPFIIGFLVGLIIKRVITLALAILALILILIATGYVSLTFRDVFDKAMEFLPKIIDLGGSLQNVFPYSSVAFLIGLLLGLLKG